MGQQEEALKRAILYHMHDDTSALGRRRSSVDCNACTIPKSDYLVALFATVCRIAQRLDSY